MPILTSVLNSSGGAILSTADATLYAKDIAGEYGSHQIYVEFFSDAAAITPVTPSAGTITIAGSPLGSVYIAASANAVITASTVNATGVATYTPPTVIGTAKNVRAIIAGIAGAAYMKITVWSKL